MRSRPAGVLADEIESRWRPMSKPGTSVRGMLRQNGETLATSARSVVRIGIHLGLNLTGWSGDPARKVRWRTRA